MSDAIPAGYQIIFCTWENDLNARATETWSGIQEPEDVRFLLAIAAHFTSQHHPRPGRGNEYLTADEMIEVVESTMARFPGISDDMRMLFDAERDECDGDDETLGERWYDLIADRILGYPEDQSYCDAPMFCRVFERASVYYFAQPVEDITEQFQ